MKRRRSSPISDRVALVLVGIEEAPAGPVDHLSQLPYEIHRVLPTETEALPDLRVMHARRVAGEEDPARAAGPRPGASCR